MVLDGVTLTQVFTIKVERLTRRAGVVAEIFNIGVGVLALVTTLERGLGLTGFIVFCAAGGAMAGDYARVQKPRDRTAILFGLIQTENGKPFRTVDPGWALVGLVAGLIALFLL